MGAFLGYGDVGVWASNAERDAFLDWFAEHRCSPGDPRRELCKAEGHRWPGCSIELSEIIPRGEVFELTPAERTAAAARYGPDFPVLLDVIAAMTRGDWTHLVSSKEANDWRRRNMTTFSTSREIPATVEQVFAAFNHPERLSRWWGPAGFTNTFSVCEFKKGGRWSFIMHGPDGRNYPNENEFAEIEPPTKIVVQHVSEPRYRLTIVLAPSAAGTVVSWSQAFESSEVAKRLERIVVPANEQNLDRLSAEVLRKPRGD